MIEARNPDAIIIGAGHNGLVAAAYLAGAGLAPLVLERADTPGGVARSTEIHPGYQCPALAHATGPLLPQVVEELGLERHGLLMHRPEICALALRPDGPGIALYQDPDRTVAGLAEISRADADAYAEFFSCLGRLGRAIAPLLLLTPPAIERPSAADLWGLLGVGRRFMGLPRRDAFRLLRYGPMSVADLTEEWFETETLRALLCARGVYGALAGPRSAGTALQLLLQAALSSSGHVTLPAAFVKGGMGALTEALCAAARARGAQIRTRAEVVRITTRDGAVTGVALRSGEEIRSRVVLSGADPRRTFLGLCDPLDLDPGFVHKVRSYRMPGVVAKVNLALSGLPAFRSVALPHAARLLSGRIHIGPTVDYLEQAFDSAKYGQISERPYLDLVMPSLSDPALAPAGGHVLSVHVQYAPFSLREGEWEGRRGELAERVLSALEEHAPGLRSMIVAQQVLTPKDLEDAYGLTGGHIHHGEMSLEQIFTFRPILHYARYRAPIAGLYLCGSGTHPGGGLTGGPGRNASREVLRDLRSRS